jgi:hypothetical protein
LWKIKKDFRYWEVANMEEEVYLIFDDHEDFRRSLEEVLQDRKELPAMLTKT